MQHDNYVDYEDDHSSVYEDAMTESDIGEIFSRPVATQKWKNRIVSYYHEDARHAVANITSWSFNRTLNLAHKDSIKKAIKKNSITPHLMGTIQVVRDKKKQIRVINGQHRLKAIEEIFKDDVDMKYSFKIMFEVYDLEISDLEDVTEDQKDIDTLFKTANHTLNFELKDDINILCRDIVRFAKKDPILGAGIDDTKPDGKKVHRPKILMKDLYEVLKSGYPNGGWNMDAHDIVTRIKEINNHISNMSNDQIFGVQTKTERNKVLSQLKRARDSNFFLNLKSKYTPDVWVKWIKDGIPNVVHRN